MSQAADKISAAYSILVFSIAFIGNFTTVIVISIYKDLQSTTNFYILNLAIADFLIGITTSPSRMMFLFEGSFQMCKVTTFMWVFFFNASVFAIFFISIDRHVFICKPLYYRSNFIATKIHYWIAISWVIAFLLAILPFVNIPHLTVQEPSKGKVICAHKFLIVPWYLTMLVILTEILPPFIFCVLYGKIIAVARKHAFQIAIQYASSKRETSTSWQERAGGTEPTVSPFEDPSYLFQVTVSDEDIRQLRRILFKDYDSWRQATEDENLQKTRGNSANGECSEVVDKKERLSGVGRSLQEWKNRARASVEQTALKHGDPPERNLGQENHSYRSSRDMGLTQLDAPVSHRTRRVTEHCLAIPRPQVARSQSYGVINTTNVNNRDIQSMEMQSKFRASAKRREKRKSGRPKIYKEFKAIKMLGMVVGMFILLHLPIALLDLIDLFGYGAAVPDWVLKVALLLTQSNPAANTMIYVATKREFRYAFMRLWTCGRLKKRLVPW